MDRIAKKHGRRVHWVLCGLLATFALARAGIDTHRTHDELDLASLAISMSEHFEAWVRPSYQPFEPNAHRELGAGIVAPPLASAFIALPRFLGIDGRWAWPIVGAAIYLAGLVALVRAMGSFRYVHAAGVVGIALAIAPRMAIHVMTLEAEIPLTGFCCLALAAALHAKHATGRMRALLAILSGFSLGAAFLCKLWLVIPAALAVAGVWISARETRKWLPAVVAVALIVASVHLMFVWIFDPSSIGRWMREVYFAVIAPGSDDLPASTKMLGPSHHPEWQHGPFYYPAAIARDLGLACVPLAVALLAVSRHWKRRVRFLAASIGFVLGLGVLTIPAIKEPLYVLPLTTALLAVAAYGLGVGEKWLKAGKALPGMTVWRLRLLVVLLGLIALLLPGPKKAVAHGDPRLVHIQARTSGKNVSDRQLSLSE